MIISSSFHFSESGAFKLIEFSNGMFTSADAGAWLNSIRHEYLKYSWAFENLVGRLVQTESSSLVRQGRKRRVTSSSSGIGALFTRERKLEWNHFKHAIGKPSKSQLQSFVALYRQEGMFWCKRECQESAFCCQDFDTNCPLILKQWLRIKKFCTMTIHCRGLHDLPLFQKWCWITAVWPSFSVKWVMFDANTYVKMSQAPAAEKENSSYFPVETSGWKRTFHWFHFSRRLLDREAKSIAEH
jgi:hypothetical protein